MENSIFPAGFFPASNAKMQLLQARDHTLSKYVNTVTRHSISLSPKSLRRDLRIFNVSSKISFSNCSLRTRVRLFLFVIPLFLSFLAAASAQRRRQLLFRSSSVAFSYFCLANITQTLLLLPPPPHRRTESERVNDRFRQNLI